MLSKPDLLRYIREGKLRFEPPVSENRIAQVSVDLLLGRKFTTFKKPPPYLHSTSSSSTAHGKLTSFSTRPIQSLESRVNGDRHPAGRLTRSLGGAVSSGPLDGEGDAQWDL